MNWYLQVLKNYANFNGRARRKEYWMFVLFNIIFSIATVLIDKLLGLALIGDSYGPFYILYHLIVFVPALAAGARRLHDVGKSGWYMFISVFTTLLIFTFKGLHVLHIISGGWFLIIGLPILIGGLWLFILFVQIAILVKTNTAKTLKKKSLIFLISHNNRLKTNLIGF